MPYRLTLVQNLPNRDPAALSITYTYNNGNPPNTWPVTPVGPDKNQAVIVVNCGTNLLNQQNVKTRTLTAHYPSAPNQIDTQISSVQPSFDSSATAQQEMEDSMTPYQVNISMPQQTVDTLTGNNYILYAFKAVKTTAKGVPLVWFQTTTYGLSTVLSWSEQYQAYTSTSAIVPNGQIVASNSYPISLDNTLNVTSPSGTGSVDTTTGLPGAISLNNQTTSPFTCGISQTQPDGSVAPMCAFPLFGGMLDVIAPIEQVLLMFSTLPVNTGTVIEQSYSPGIFIDLTGEPSRNVGFDINQGWTWDGGPWARSIPASSQLVPLLIQSSPSLATRQLTAFHNGKHRVEAAEALA